YDTSHRMVTLTDARGIAFLQNAYDAAGRVIQQTQADGSVYRFGYSLDATGRITQTDVTDPRGAVPRVTFNAGGYAVSDTRALGSAEQQSVSYERQASSQLLLSKTDALGRRTSYAYDAVGNVTAVTRLAGTPGAVTNSFAYEPVFSQVTSMTDPL